MTSGPVAGSAAAAAESGAPRSAGQRPGPTPTTVRRLPRKQVRDRAALDAVLDAALVAHLAVVEGRQPFVVPLGCARDGDRLLVHGSTASRALRILATGAPTCATITLLDGIVVARSQFESSMHYRCAMVFGSLETLHGPAKEAGLAVLSRHLLPGLDGARTPSRQELAATAVLALALDEWSLKVSDAPPEDAEEDLDREVWAGVLPLTLAWGEPVPAPDLRVAVPAPTQPAHWMRPCG